MSPPGATGGVRAPGRLGLTREERRRLAGLGAAILALHLVGWGLVLVYAHADPALAGLGVLAYTLGLRHAFDADHIAAIDNTTRRFLEAGQRPLAVGFFFALGHATVVLSLAVGVAVSAGPVEAHLPGLQRYGGPVGLGVSGTFLWIIGLLNLLVLVDIVRSARSLRAGPDDPEQREQLERRLLDRGLFTRFLGPAMQRIRASRQMFPLGLLFGLGLDTATEVGLLALAAGAASGNAPFLGVLALPLLFAAGMTLMDTADGVLMSRAYGWAFASPARKLHYNVTVTSLSVAVALGVGTVELLQVATAGLGAGAGPLGAAGRLDLGLLGYGVVGLFLLTWAVSAIVWRVRQPGRGPIRESG